MRVGLPVALQDGLVNMLFLVINDIVNSLGVIPSAGVGVVMAYLSFFHGDLLAGIFSHYDAGDYGGLRGQNSGLLSG